MNRQRRPDTCESKNPAMEVASRQSAPTSRRTSSAYQLNPLWERVVRTRRLPAEVDLAEVFDALRRRMRDPEREVRQHALRVLADLIPAVRSSLDLQVAPLLPDLVLNLGHSAPAVRKGALDALGTYLSHSDKKDTVLTELCTKCVEKNSINDKFREDVTVGVIIALPSLLSLVLSPPSDHSESSETVVRALSSKLFQVMYQEVSTKSLMEVRDIIGEEAFNKHIESLDPSVGENFKLLCEVYEASAAQKQLSGDSLESPPDYRKRFSEENTSSFEQDTLADYSNHLMNGLSEEESASPTVTVGLDNSESMPNGKVILETEINFDSDTAVTMTVLEEDELTNESDDGAFGLQSDGDKDEYRRGASKRTPRRVRFGGEVVKMRTPDGDDSRNDNSDAASDTTEPTLIADNTDDDDDRDEESLRRYSDGGSTDDSPLPQNIRRSRSMIPLPTVPTKGMPRYRKDCNNCESLESGHKKKSKSLDDLSQYCKVRYGTAPNRMKELPEMAEGEIRFENDVHTRKNGLPGSYKCVPPKRSTAQRRVMMSENYFSPNQSGNSSTGSSSDNAFDEFTLDDLDIFDDDTFEDLYKMEGQRGAIRALERLTQRLSNPEAARSLDANRVSSLASRLGSVQCRARGRASDAAALALRTLVRGAGERELRVALPHLATALAGSGTSLPALSAEMARRLPPADFVDALINENSVHWKSSKLRAGALRAVSHTVRALPCAGLNVRAVAACAAACALSPRRRVRAAALDTLAALATLATPRIVLAEVHREAADREDGDLLYEAVLARLCRPVESGGAGGAGVGIGVSKRPDVAWVMAGSDESQPSSAYKFSDRAETWKRSPHELSFPPPTARPAYHADRDGGGHRRMEGRVVTAPATAGIGSGFTLRPLVMPATMQQVSWAQPGPMWPRQGVIWPPNQQQAAPPTQPGNCSQGSQLGSSWPQAGRGGSWPGRRPPAPLRALSPPHTYARWGPNSNERSVQLQHTGDAEQSFWSPKHRNAVQATRQSEGLGSSTTIVKTPPSPGHHQRLSHYLSKDDEYDVSLKQYKSEGVGSVNGELPSPGHLAPVTPVSKQSASSRSTESKSNITVPIGSPRRLSVEASPRRFAEEAPIVQNDFEDEVFQREVEERVPKSPSVDTSRFINDVNQVDEITVEDEVDSYKQEDRFINLKSRSPSIDVVDHKTLHSDKLSVTSRISAESPIRSESIRSKPSPARNPTPATTPTPVSPVSNRLSVGAPSVDAEVESLGSAFSEVSLKESFKSSGGEEEDKSMGNGVSNMCGVSGDKISPIAKVPRKGRIIPKGLNGKPSGNKIKPVSVESVSAAQQGFEKPKEALAKCIAQLENPDWETVMIGLKSMERLVKNHPNFLETNMTPIARAVANQIKNLRSQVARSACRLSGDMFATHKRALEADAEELVVPLLNRTADTNKFLRSDANAALDVMCVSLSLQKSICLIMARGTVHQNAVVRCTSARLLADIAGNFGFEKIFAIPKEIRDKLFVTGSDLLTEGSSETRGHAKRLFKNLSQHQMFLRTLREVIPLTKYRNIEKALNNLRLQ